MDRLTKKTIEEIALEDGRYDPKALTFIFEGLGKTVEKIHPEKTEGSRHVTGQQLAVGLGEVAKDQWGRLSKTVLNQWGVYRTRDFGEIVYLMIDNGWMSRQDTDRIEDFDSVFDFGQFFEGNYRFEME